MYLKGSVTKTCVLGMLVFAAQNEDLS